MRILLLLLLLLPLTGCANRLSNNVARAMLNNPDPATVRQGIPSYLLLLEGLLRDDCENQKLLISASSLHALGSSLETSDPSHRLRMAEQAWRYGQQAICARDEKLCHCWERPLPEFNALLKTRNRSDVPALYTLGISRLALLQATNQSYQALAELPRLDALFARLVELDEGYEQGGPQLYLGILRLQRPPSLGGRPEEGRTHLERAIELSSGRNLAARMELARLYARMIYDRELHDALLHEVLSAEPAAEGLTLFNVLAQEEARRLLDSADSYFP
ncbi:MAG: TRAP transporter TatT component family protein [Desulfuromonadaceae bacterium]